MSEAQALVTLRQQQDYRFEIDFGAGVPALLADEKPPLGGGAGPTPVQLLAAAVGNCLSDSLLFALRKFKNAPEPIHCEVRADIGRNEAGRLRVQSLEVRLTLGVPADGLQHLERVLDQFEQFCTVASSVSQAIPVRVHVHDASGRALK